MRGAGKYVLARHRDARLMTALPCWLSCYAYRGLYIEPANGLSAVSSSTPASFTLRAIVICRSSVRRSRHTPMAVTLIRLCEDCRRFVAPSWWKIFSRQPRRLWDAARTEVDSQAPSSLHDDGGRMVEVRREIIEICGSEFDQFPIVLHGPRRSAMLADHRIVSLAVPIDRRMMHLIADVVTTRQAFAFYIRKRHNHRSPNH
jgi:hypothetical protein